LLGDGKPTEYASRRIQRRIFTAIVANLAITGCKFVAATFTRSSAMLAEAVHPSVDTGDRAAAVGLCYPVEVELVGDSKSTLCELIPPLKRKDVSFGRRRRQE